MESRFSKLLQRLVALEEVFQGHLQEVPAKTHTDFEADAALTNGVSSQPIFSGFTPSSEVEMSECEQRLTFVLKQRAFSYAKFVRVPGDYYDQPLEERMALVGAPSTDHLCKSMVMVNTKASTGIKYYLIILQYTEARVHGEKLKNFLYEHNNGTISKKNFNLRLAPEDVSDELSGFEHNAVSPIGFKTEMPIILSHKITMLKPSIFFVGAGEVDLKLGMLVDEFVQVYNPFVVDCTYD